MLLLALFLIVLAALLGAGLAAWHLHDGEWQGRRIPPWSLGLLHGGMGLAGLATLLIALIGSATGGGSGAVTLGYVAAVILTVALLVGMVPLTSRLRHSPMPLPSVVFGIHGTIAVYGTIMLIAVIALAI